MKYLVSFAYDASNYYGYQKQIDLYTVQEELERALTSINAGKEVKVVSSSRTDRGVHALNQKAHFELNMDITCYKLKRALNSKLPNDIHINSVMLANDDFHARYNALRKEYLYIINMGEYNPIERNYVYQYNKELDVDKMSEALNLFVGRHDFSAFTSKDVLKDKVREIYEVNIRKEENKIYLTFIGNGFLKYQIRKMVGTLIEIGNDKKNKEDLIKLLNNDNSIRHARIANPEGLYLIDVYYK